MSTPIKILAVDDIASNLTALDAVLAKPDVEIVHANSGAQALELLLEHEFGLAILDVHMPEMDGFELAELMRGSKRTSHIPILFLTAAGEDSQRAFRGYASGAVDFLFKPIDARVLAAKVDVFVQLARNKQQMAEQLKTAEQLLKTNEMLMAVLAHDLRTPLSAIIASASFLGRFGGEEKLRPATDRIQRSSERMARMVDQLLHVARLHGGRVHLNPMKEDVHAICTAIVDEYEVAYGKGRIAISSHGNTMAQIDPDLISQVMTNLIGNALHHGDAQTPISVKVNGEDAARVSITVRNGGAIDPAVLPHIFEAFRSGASSGSQSGALGGVAGVANGGGMSQGLGLGLYITRELVTLHGGTVDAHSGEGETVFLVTLPREGSAGE
ncbi:hybrid sensor histidine kinase/response regulator [Cupriavidus plantarum]|uniref:hybrid sensor histidine kinase/response regulator n=1 Tax=Cupriavidus plantarum TaxID=942865 RepID=UPI000EB2FDF0|nr:hybrid sensor histidine kinase/response regulator [Cupriavidus plantarum]RLK39542.1 response regulator receiver sensor signal transduction histidine kinase [Cupriavidus plantarum]